MVRPRSSPSSMLLAGTAASLVLVGCSAGTGGDPAAGCPVPIPAPPAETGLIPAGLSFDKIGTVTHVTSTQGHLTVHAVSTKPIDEVTVLIQDAVTAVGYRPAGMDNEGFEAEVFFTSGSYAAGQAVVRQAMCEGQWDIDLVLIDPNAVPSPTALPIATSMSSDDEAAAGTAPTAAEYGRRTVGLFTIEDSGGIWRPVSRRSP